VTLGRLGADEAINQVLLGSLIQLDRLAPENAFDVVSDVR
jgi:hypothetical protein